MKRGLAESSLDLDAVAVPVGSGPAAAPTAGGFVDPEGAIADRRMSYLVALVEQQSFARAAAYCGVTQSALSQQITKLERDLGVTLLDRSLRPFALTPVGQEIYTRALAILQHYREIQQAARQSVAGRIGRVRAGIVPTLLYLGEVPEALYRVRAQLPDVQVDLTRMDNVVAVNRLTDQQLDVVFTFSGVDAPGIQGALLHEERLVVALPKDHRLASRTSLSLLDLRAESFISFPREAYAGGQDDLVHAARELGFSPEIRTVHATYIEHAGFVAAGYGIALVPQSMATTHLGGVVTVPLDGSGLRVRTWMYWRTDHVDPALQNFVAAMSEQLGIDRRTGDVA
ncbi:LysR family transcriptional regulator [Nakamurella sp. YIM 132087]|uniref:LysR family transcriptional regulator n=1 Tax=Nakamurella alba TaxID=2665158 RepID=A0A7K1FQ55_9ACTN|nr:LysR family transcriptional regulator [Nakamurella alba]MTD16271.1 LysR family transcriptional regulator [Nakamurella alba]